MVVVVAWNGLHRAHVQQYAKLLGTTMVDGRQRLMPVRICTAKVPIMPAIQRCAMHLASHHNIAYPSVCGSVLSRSCAAAAAHLPIHCGTHNQLQDWPGLASTGKPDAAMRPAEANPCSMPFRTMLIDAL